MAATALTGASEREKGSPDLWLLVLTVLLVAIGLVSVFSSSYVMAQDRHGDSLYYLKRQVIFLVGLGLPALWLGLRIRSETLRGWSVPLLIVAAGLLLAVLYFGSPVGGAKRWLGFGPVSFQPSEVAKVAVVVCAAWYITWKGKGITQLWGGLVPLLVGVGAICGLILCQPDMSTSLVVAVIVIGVLFVGGAKWQHVIAILLILCILAGVAVAFAPYRAKRIAAFLDPEQHKQGAAFQPYQSLIALGSGGPTGVGFSRSTQKYYYIPAAFTDFIFAIIGEEWGFAGAVVVLALFSLFVARAIGIARTARDVFSALAACGIAIMIAAEAAVHIAVATNSIPATGMPLPFISYGGSSLVVKLFCVGFLLSVSRRAVV